MRQKRGFSLVELMIVIAVISTIATVFMMVFSPYARERAREASCLSNLGQLTLAYQMYTQDYGRGPSREALPDGLMPYVKNSQVFRCPAARDEAEAEQQAGGAGAPPYKPYDWWSGPWGSLKRVDYFIVPDVEPDDLPQTVLVGDSEPRHRGRGNIGRLAGGLKGYPEAEWRKLAGPHLSREEAQR